MTRGFRGGGIPLLVGPALVALGVPFDVDLLRSLGVALLGWGIVLLLVSSHSRQ